MSAVPMQEDLQAMIERGIADARAAECVAHKVLPLSQPEMQASRPKPRPSAQISDDDDYPEPQGQPDTELDDAEYFRQLEDRKHQREIYFNELNRKSWEDDD